MKPQCSLDHGTLRAGMKCPECGCDISQEQMDAASAETEAPEAPEPPKIEIEISVPLDKSTKADSSRVSSAQTFKREASFEPAGLNTAKRTCELSFSSELPVQRGDYMEVLSHDAGDCDLSRLNDSHPLLLNHDPERQIGVVESAAIGADKRGRAVVRFSKSPLGDEIWNDVKDGIRRLVSVGYRRTKELTSETRDGMDFVRFAWQPYEVSIVSVPADSTVGIGRGTAKQTKEKDSTMSLEVTNETPKRDYQKTASEILAIAANLEGKVPNIREMANAAITSGKDVAEFRAQALDKLPEVQPVGNKSALSEVKARDWKNYSLSRAISMMLPGSKADGFEREISDEMSLKTGSRPTGLWIPDEAFVASRNFVAGTNTLGGFLVQTDNAADQFVELLRNRAQVLNLGARVLNLSRPTTIPRQNAAGGVTMVAETTASTLSTGNFTQFTLTPQAASAYQQYSKQLLMENNPSIDALIRDDIMQQIALRIDLAALHGSGSGEPTGIIATTGIGTVLLATNGQALGNTTAYPAMVSLESKVATANADVGALAYLMRPGQRGALKTAARFASSDTPVWDWRVPSNPVNGYRAEVTNQIATNLTEGTATTICSTIFFGNWNDLIVAQFGGVDITADPYSKAENGLVRILARRWFDIGIRHPASFAVLGGVLTT